MPIYYLWFAQFLKGITALEKVQRKAARFVTTNYGLASSVTNILHQLAWVGAGDWRYLTNRQLDARLTLL